ncbi:co-chaperone GroES [Streptobacillus felis]|uniref:10 kDa chaperonin n=2 Tax=Streptobacillus felis TaxID=1384509 RepID=A0A7Z0PDE4_9FUSO|nr:co-chaperone GroES family protein [Streptobacillus felis]NYV27219.1 co-chaperone GroES [Streptobacillus felis]
MEIGHNIEIMIFRVVLGLLFFVDNNHNIWYNLKKISHRKVYEMEIKPLGNRILIEKVKTEKKTRSGLILSENVEAENNFAKVIEVSEKIEKNIQIGQYILVDLDKAMEVRYDGLIRYIINVEDVYAVIGGYNE